MQTFLDFAGGGGFEKQLQRFAEIVARFFNGMALAGDIHFRTERDVPIIFALDYGGQSVYHHYLAFAAIIPWIPGDNASPANEEKHRPERASYEANRCSPYTGGTGVISFPNGVSGSSWALRPAKSR